MIRRGFWLVAGAAIGVAGYRKATRLARTLTGQASVSPQLPQLPQSSGAGAAPWPVRLGAGARSAAAFIRDVRAGMADYRADHGRPDPASFPAAGDESEPAGFLADGGGPDPAGAGDGRGAPGQANGRARHDGQIGRSLGSRSPENPGGQAQPGSGQRDPREH
jgi:hypothetical protein